MNISTIPNYDPKLTQKKIWVLKSLSGREESFVFQTIVLPGSASSVGSHANILLTQENEAESRSSECDFGKGETTSTKKTKVENRSKTVISTLVSTSEHYALLTLASSISSSPPPIKDPAHVIRKTSTKGFGMFAQRDIAKGELIVWERPGIIAPGLEWEDGKMKGTEREQVYGLLAHGFVDLESLGGHPGNLGNVDIELVDVELIDEGRKRLEDIRGMAISSCFGGEQWVEGVIRTNALVLELFKGNKKRKNEGKVIYGGVCPLINRCNHSCCPNAAVHFTPSILTFALYALRNIRVGEEITKSYVNPLLPKEKRKDLLRRNYGFDCDCRACMFPGPNSDEDRIKLLSLLSTPTFKRWSCDITRSDDFLAQAHSTALDIIEAEEVYAVEGIFLEDLALASALLGDKQGFMYWAMKIVSGGRWIDQMEINVEGKSERKEMFVADRRKWLWWLEKPEKKVKKWGWRKRAKEELRRQNGVELEVGMLEGIFGSADN